MKVWLSPHCALKLLESPSAYDINTDELYELDEEAMAFLIACSSRAGVETEKSDFVRFCLEEGILSTDAVYSRRAPMDQSPLPSLRYLELQITRRCNLRCGHCYIGPPLEEELCVSDIESILSEFERMQGLRLLITGGEPLLHREFQSINRMLPEFALRSVLFTNGTLLTDKILSSLNVHEIQISIDGMDEAHDRLRGAGSYKAAMSAIRRALAHGLEVSVSTMIHPANLGDFEMMESEFRTLGVRDWTVDVPCPEGNLRDNPAHMVLPESAGHYLAYGYGGSMHGGEPGYGCGRHLMSVMADGACAKCAFYSNRPDGTVKTGLASCWKNVRHYRLDELDCNCEFVSDCRGGCRYRAFALGDETGRDLYKCALYGILKT